MPPPVNPLGEPLSDNRRSTILETVVRLSFPTVLLLSLLLLMRGHNQPGGGFVGGLVAGLGFVLRYVAGGRAELRTAVPVAPGLPLGLGLVLATVTGMAAWPFGGAFLESAILKFHPPLLGEVKFVTALFFDVGVYLVVVGMVLGILRTMGSEAER